MLPLKTGYDWRAAAQRLVEQRKARDFYEACSLLARRRKRKAVSVPSSTTLVRLPYADN